MFVLSFVVIALVAIETKCATVPEKFVPPRGYGRFQGDMLMSVNDIKIAKNGGTVGAENSQGAAAGNKLVKNIRSGRLWQNGVVPYVLTDVSLFNQGSRTPINVIKAIKAIKAIKDAMKEWKKNTTGCIRFVEKTNQDYDYIQFNIDGVRCLSHVGRIGGKQVISVGLGCKTKGIMLHMIGHALGLHHEQSRPDRDVFVKINYENIANGQSDNFSKYSVAQINTDQHIEYDYDSIMHFGENAFGKYPGRPWLTTITPLKKGVSIGQRKKLSVFDVAKIKRLYKCN